MKIRFNQLKTVSNKINVDFGNRIETYSTECINTKINGIFFSKQRNKIEDLNEIKIYGDFINAKPGHDAEVDYIFSNETKNTTYYNSYSKFIDKLRDIIDTRITEVKVLDFTIEELNSNPNKLFNSMNIDFKATVIKDFDQYENINIPFAKSISIPYGVETLYANKIFTNKHTVIYIPPTLNKIYSKSIKGSDFVIENLDETFGVSGVVNDVVWLGEPLSSIDTTMAEFLNDENNDIALVRNGVIKTTVDVDRYINITGLQVDDDGYITV